MFCRDSTTRRVFLKQADTAAGAAVLTPYLWTSASAQESSANDRPGVGAIGTNIYTNRYTGAGEHPGRGAVIGHQAAKFGDMRAVADVNPRHAPFFAQEYDGKCEIYQDYRRLLDFMDIDCTNDRSGRRMRSMCSRRPQRLPIPGNP